MGAIFDDCPDGVDELLAPAGAPGLYLRAAPFIALVDTLARGFALLRAGEGAPVFQAPPVVGWPLLQRCAYPDRFPQLVATVRPLLPAAADATDAAADGALLPAACLPLYAVAAARGRIPADGWVAGVTASCHRCEAAYSPVRMRAFTMSEWVFFGAADQAEDFRAAMVDQCRQWLSDLGLEGRVQPANDPFWGRARDILADTQRAQGLKLEMVTSIGGHGDVACLSFNHHGEFFGQRWDILREGGETASSACVGVGLERLALALISRHGPQPRDWPVSVRQRLETRA